MKSRLGAKGAGSWADPNDPAYPQKKAEILTWSRIDSSFVLLFTFLISGFPYGLRGKRHNALNCG